MKLRSCLSHVLLAALVPIIWTTALRAEECAVFFEHPHQGGAAWGIEAETQSTNISNAMIERRGWCGSLRGYCKGRDRSWNDSISSIQVNPGCTLMTWAHQDFTGESRQYTAIDTANVYGALTIDDQISSFRCSCALPPDSSKASVTYYFAQPDEFSEAEAP